MRDIFILYKDRTGWNRSQMYIAKIRARQDRLLRRVLPKEDSYDYEADKDWYLKLIEEVQNGK